VLPRAQLAELVRLVRQVGGEAQAERWVYGGAGYQGNTEVRLLEGQAYEGIKEWWQG